jgi:hypothetical protein
MPTTYDKTNGTAGFPWDGSQKAVVLKNRVTVAVTTTSGDTIQALDVPAGFHCLGTKVKIVTPSLAGNQVDVGDGDGTDSWDANIDCTAAANTAYVSAAGTDAYATAMKHYAAADTIDLLVNADVNGLVVDIWAFGFNLS